MNIEMYYPREGNEKVSLTCYLHLESPEMPNQKRNAMLVLPGGGYVFCSDRESEVVGLQYFAAGFNVFVLRYSIQDEAIFPAPLVDASLSMKYIRDNAERFCIDPARVFAIGFSAGGHLCASLGTFWNAPFLREAVELEGEINKPTGTILGYPVIEGGKGYSHNDSFYHILGTTTPTDEEFEKYSVNLHVSSETSPVFMFHTSDDACVPVKNALRMAEALTENSIPYELLIFPHGPHGISISNEQTSNGIPQCQDTEIAKWVQMSIEWIKRI